MFQFKKRRKERKIITFLSSIYKLSVIKKMIAAWQLYRKKHFRTGETPDMFQPEEEIEWENPYLPYARLVIEQILKRRNLDYRNFRPILIDTDCPNQVFGEADDVDQVLSQLEQGLNFLEICTDRPDYFSEWKNRMEEEYGLIVRVVEKTREFPFYGNVILDFERCRSMLTDCFDEHVIYLPFQKQKWYAETVCKSDAEGESVQTEKNRENARISDEKPGGKSGKKSGAEVLDINVPIGYNRIIVEVERLVL